MLKRIDGWISGDPTRLPNSVARLIADNFSSPGGRSEIDRIRARVMARQMMFERATKYAMPTGENSVC
jgi:hypothetical protein